MHTRLTVGLSLIALTAACQDPSRTTQVVTTVAMEAAKGGNQNPREVLRYHLPPGAKIRTAMVEGKQMTLELESRNGKPHQALLLEGERAINRTVFKTKGKTITGMTVTWYDSTGHPTYTTEHAIRETDVLGRCLQRLLGPQLLYAAPVELTKCGREFLIMTGKGAAAATLFAAATAACAIPGNIVACVFAQGLSLTASNDWGEAMGAYMACMNAPTGTPGGTGTGTPPAGGGTTGGTGTTQGTCYTVTTYIYSTTTGQLLSKTVKTTCDP